LTCTRCGGTGFLNGAQVPDNVFNSGIEATRHWMITTPIAHDVQVCDCCGNGEEWHGQAGEHYGRDDPRGENGPYAYNGGLAECN
jgi:hypothetical protein